MGLKFVGPEFFTELDYIAGSKYSLQDGVVCRTLVVWIT